MPRQSLNTDSKIYKLRDALGLSQDEFAEKIGLTRSGISNLESEKRKITESNFKLICSTFNVNPDWLRTGEGEMFNLNEDDELAYLVGGLFAEESSFKKRFVKTMLKLDEKQWEDVERFINLLAKEED